MEPLVHVCFVCCESDGGDSEENDRRINGNGEDIIQSDGDAANDGVKNYDYDDDDAE